MLTCLLTLNLKEPLKSRKSVTLRIETIIGLGDESSAPFGDPSNLEEKYHLQETVSTLYNLFIGDQGAMRDESISPIRSQAEDSRINDESSPFQTKFATQAGFIMEPPEFSPKLRAAPIESGNVTAPIEKGSLLLATLKVSKAQTNRQRENELPERSPKLLVHPVQNVSCLSPLKSSTDNDKSENTSRLNTAANIQCRQSSLPLAGSQVIQRVPVPAEAGLKSSSRRPRPSENVEEDSPESAERPAAAFRLQAENMNKSERGEESSISLSLLEYTKEMNSFQSMKRVPRSFIRVAAEQQSILDKEDSWLCPEIDSRSIYSKIPPGILHHLTDLSHQPFQQTSMEKLQDDEDRASNDTEEESDRSEDGSKELHSTSDPDVRSDVPMMHVTTHPASITTSSMGMYENFDEIEASDDQSEEEVASSWPSSPPEHAGRSEILHSPEYHELHNKPEQSVGDAQSETPLTGMPQAAVPIPTSIPRIDDPSSVLSKPKTRQYNEFPSSSLGVEDELELDIPHAVGDDVDENIEDFQQEFPPKFPSTATDQQPMVHVEQTPTYYQGLKDSTTKRISLTGQHIRGSDTTEYSRYDISSDPVIPATFNDHNSQGHLTTTQEGTVTLNTGDFMAHSKSENTNATCDFKMGDDLVQQQIMEEWRSSQLNDRSKTNLLPAKVIPYSQENAQTAEFSKQRVEGARSPANVSPAHVPSTHISKRACQPESNMFREPETRCLKRNIGAVLDNTKRPGLKRRKYSIKPTNFHMSQEVDNTFQTIGEMTRTINRTIRHKLTLEEAGATLREQEIAREGMLQSRSSEPVASLKDIGVSMGECRSRSPSLQEDVVVGEEYLDLENLVPKERVAPSKSAESVSYGPRKLPLAVDVPLGREISLSTDKYPKFDSQSTALDAFRSEYSSYRGNHKQFAFALCYIRWNKLEKDLPGHDLWDDFVRCFSAEYSDYICKLSEAGTRRGDDTLSAPQFFSSRVTTHLFDKNIITAANLTEAISSLNPDDVELATAMLKKPGNRRTSDAKILSEEDEDSATVPSLQNPQGSFTESVGNDFQSSIAIDASKQPFFETHSQSRQDQHKAVMTSEERSNPVSQTPQGSRRLLWSKTAAPKTSSPIKKVPAHYSSVLPTTPSARTQSHRNLAAVDAGSSSKGSPILGAVQNDASKSVRTANPPTRSILFSSSQHKIKIPTPVCQVHSLTSRPKALCKG